MIAFLNRDNPANSFMRLHFGAKAVQILLERVLSDTVYRSEIRVGEENSGNHWKKLLQISMEIFLVTLLYTFITHPMSLPEQKKIIDP